MRHQQYATDLLRIVQDLRPRLLGQDARLLRRELRVGEHALLMQPAELGQRAEPLAVGRGRVPAGTGCRIARYPAGIARYVTGRDGRGDRYPAARRQALADVDRHALVVVPGHRHLHRLPLAASGRANAAARLGWLLAGNVDEQLVLIDPWRFPGELAFLDDGAGRLGREHRGGPLDAALEQPPVALAPDGERYVHAIHEWRPPQHDER